MTDALQMYVGALAAANSRIAELEEREFKSLAVVVAARSPAPERSPAREHALISEAEREAIKSKLRDAEAELRLIIEQEQVDEFTSSDLRGVIRYIQEIIAKL